VSTGGTEPNPALPHALFEQATPASSESTELDKETNKETVVANDDIRQQDPMLVADSATNANQENDATVANHENSDFMQVDTEPNKDRAIIEPNKKGARTKFIITIDSPEDSSDDEFVAATMVPFDDSSSEGSTPSSSSQSSSPRTPTMTDEALLLERLNTDITLSEERETVGRLDTLVLRGEDVTRQRDIEKPQALERALKKPKVATHVVTGVDQESAQDQGESWFSWQRKRPNENVSPRPSIIVEDVVQRVLYQAKHSIPKYLLDDQRIFSRADFQNAVIDGVEKFFGAEDASLLYAFKVNLRERHHSYLLEAKGPGKVLEKVASYTQDWIQYQIAHANLQLLLQDGESQLVDIAIPVDEADPLKNLHYLSNKTRVHSKEGVFMHSSKLKPNDGLVKALGGMKPFKGGCAIMTINRQPANSPNALKKLVIKAKKEKPTDSIKVTLCLSSLTNLTEIDQSKILLLRRRDSKPYDPKFYEDLRCQLWIENALRPGEKKSWVEYPPEDAPPPKPLPARAPGSEKEKEKAMEDILNDPKSVEVSLIITAREGLGAGMLQRKEAKPGDQGVWMHTFEPKRQLMKILGEKACKLGAVLLRAFGRPVNNSNDLQASEDQATSGTYRATFVFYDGTDLSRVDRSKLGQGQVNPRRRNGQPYPLHLYAFKRPNPDAETSEEAGNKKRQHATENNDDERSSKKTRSEEDVDFPNSAVGDDDVVDVDDDGDDFGSRPARKPVCHRMDKLQLFHKFKNKYKELIVFEYQGTGIHTLTCCSSMWTQHKQLYGDEAVCDDQCKCFAKLKELTRCVFDDYIKAQTKKGNFVADGPSLRTAGVVQHFAPRFLKKLYKEYPGDTPSELIQRLVDMWGVHMRHGIFGLRCRKECECGEEWEWVFCKGDKEKAEKMKMSTKRRTSGPSLKKRKLTATLSPSNSDADSQTNTVSQKQKPNGSEKRPSLQVNYEVTFDTFAPLGAYFVTATGPSGNTSCKIHAVCDRGGQAKSDPRLHPGKFCSRQ
jgi:hypothetical protein